MTVQDSWRVTLAIAAKDIREAFKNRTILSNIVMAGVIVVMWQVLPGFYPKDELDVVIFDPAGSQLSAVVDASPDLYRVAVNSLDELQAGLSDELVGLAVPADLDQQVAAGGPVELTGYVQWSQRRRAEALVGDLEQQLGDLMGVPVTIQATGNWVQPDARAMGTFRFAAVILVVVLIYTNMAVVPLLMLEEKQARTLDMLRISPAGSSQIVMGKALAGLVIGLMAAALAIGVGWTLVVHWGLLILVTIAGALCAVGFGLLLGSLVELRQQYSMLMLPVSTALMLPVFLNAIDPLLPEALRAVLHWTPTVALAMLVRAGLAGPLDWGLVAQNAGILTLWVAPMFGVLVWKLNRADR